MSDKAKTCGNCTYSTRNSCQRSNQVLCEHPDRVEDLFPFRMIFASCGKWKYKYCEEGEIDCLRNYYTGHC